MTRRFITFEGIDGAGKSTHLQALANHLRSRGQTVIITREPGGSPLAERLREIVLHEPMDLVTETLLMFAARRDHVQTIIRPALAAGHWVISDRFTDSTFAYQGSGRGLDWAWIESLERQVLEDLAPMRTFLFDLAPELAQIRREATRSPDRFEAETQAFFGRIRAGYLRRAQEHAERFTVIDASRSLDDIAKELEEYYLTL